MPCRIAAALCAALFLFGACGPSAADDETRLTAMLLVAQAGADDPVFGDSVVLVMNNLADGPVGVIVNRPTAVAVAELFPDIGRLATVADKVYFGGPVEFGRIWFLIRASKPPAHAVRALEGVYLSGDRGLLRRLLERPDPMDGLRIFVGHAGWAPGQLEDEIAHGDWTLQQAGTDAVFSPRVVRPWPDRQEPAVST
jgi:putative transcriptional regulator